MATDPRILVVDDNRGAAELFGMYFERRGFRLAFAYCGLTGWRWRKSPAPTSCF